VEANQDDGEAEASHRVGAAGENRRDAGAGSSCGDDEADLRLVVWAASRTADDAAATSRASERPLGGAKVAMD
jgi:hypothetical protein